MQWFSSLSFNKKIQIGGGVIIALFSIPLLVIALLSDYLLISLIVVASLIGVSLYLLKLLEKALSSTFTDIAYIASNIAKGDFTQQVNIYSDDAIGQLGASFNDMIEKLRNILRDTTEIAKTVSDSSRNMYQKNQNMKEVIGQVTLSTNELATGANEISENVSDVSIAVRDIEGKVSAYNQSAQQMNERSSKMVNLVNRGRQAVESQSTGMKNNIEATANVSRTISELAQQTAGISKITRTISELAEQTNLLSLNASIEAARAGEHGRGFAVVAQEVRNLAEASFASTSEVFNLVKRIEQGIEEAIENIKRNEEIVQLQNEYIDETGKIFAEIVDNIQFITEQIQDFSKESEQMLSNAQQISATMQNISAITEQAAAGTQQVSASMNEQIQGVEQTVEQSEEMMKKALQLQRTIEIFKI